MCVCGGGVKIWLSFLYTTHRHILFIITVMYYDNILKGSQVMGQT